jgi:hypothetical protein
MHANRFENQVIELVLVAIGLATDDAESFVGCNAVDPAGWGMVLADNQSTYLCHASCMCKEPPLVCGILSHIRRLDCVAN